MSNSNEAGIAFLNENLKDYFKGRDNSITGTASSVDALGNSYTSYGFEMLDVPCLSEAKRFSGLKTALDEITQSVENILSGLTQGKSAEKPQGATVKKRGSQIHWRSYPTVEINEGSFDANPKMAIFFRVSIYHI